jgi:hypothetical protein
MVTSDRLQVECHLSRASGPLRRETTANHAAVERGAAVETKAGTLTGRRRAAIVIGVLVAVLAAVPAAAIAGQPPDPFLGSWRSVDFDGSNQKITFGGPGEIRRVVYLDDMGTICDGERFFAEGVGFVDGNTIFTFLEQYCGSAGAPFGDLGLEFTYDPATGTLTDGFDIVWTRH